jgi:hypothetical protein
MADLNGGPEELAVHLAGTPRITVESNFRMRYPASVSLRTSQDSSCFDRQAGLDLFNSFFNIAGAENPQATTGTTVLPSF